MHFLLLNFCCFEQSKFFHWQIAHGFRRNLTKTILTWLAVICSLGIVRLIFYWMEHWMLLCTHSACDLKDADQILLIVSCLIDTLFLFFLTIQSNNQSRSDVEQNNRKLINQSIDAWMVGTLTDQYLWTAGAQWVFSQYTFLSFERRTRSNRNLSAKLWL